MIKRNAKPLGETLKEMMENLITPRQQKCYQLNNIWQELLPEELSGHCEIVEFTAGMLKIRTDGPGYSHELNLCRKMLLDEMNKALSGFRVRDIKISV